ncbi:DoxX family protein [Noviherbaspirillum denitrificans]|uniref:DoxX family protein n=1 Tax=Noviherbaspirillum denitrificans TaxID=1968433 RepID=A0A254TE95_9BURK|nr:DoxX family protein [Noviherbaspirillum denitrificans]OWW20976.1 hypothetical protein AYR66_17375 [Noviherbaspirillum denitrificans]
MSRLLVLGRALVGVLFFWAGVDKLLGWPQALAEVAGAGLPVPELLLALTILLQLAGGAALIAGRLVLPAALALAAFTALATVLFHDFWNAEGPARHAQLIPFMEHIAIIGALLMASALPTDRHR